MAEETFLDDETFLDEKSFLLLDDNKKIGDNASAPHDSPQALAADKAPAEGDAGCLASSALDRTAAPWHPLREKPVLLDPDAFLWHPTEDEAKEIVPVTGTETSEGSMPGTAAEAAETVLRAWAAVLLTAMAAALPARVLEAAHAETTSATPDQCRLMAIQILAKSKGKRKLVDRSKRWQKYLKRGGRNQPQRRRDGLERGGIDGAHHTRRKGSGSTDGAHHTMKKGT